MQIQFLSTENSRNYSTQHYLHVIQLTQYTARSIFVIQVEQRKN